MQSFFCELKLTNFQIWASIFLSRHTAISAIATMNSKTRTLGLWDPIKASEVKPSSQHVDAPFALGLVEVMNSWVTAQRKSELQEIRTLTLEQQEYYEDIVNPKKYGCILPPSSFSMPKIFHKDFDFKTAGTDGLIEDNKKDMQKCLDILQSSCFPWSAQFSSTQSQHHTGIAISTMQLDRDRNHYQHYLGEDIVWDLYSKILGLLLKIAPSFEPWHGISSTDRTSNPIQIILRHSLHQESIGPLVGATMAQRTAAINERYRVGLKQIGKAVRDMAVYEHEGTEYISYDVNLKLHDLCQVCHS